MTRSLIREYIFKLLFRLEFNSAEDMKHQTELFLADTVADEDMPIVPADIPDTDKEYICNKVASIVDNLNDIDAKIADVSKGWTIERIGKVEIAVLRLAVYEMIYDDDIPVGVAIDEAVDITKKYGQSGSPSFVNGVLAALAKDV